MNILGIFKRNKAPTASLAKERLKIIVEHSRSDAKRPEFLNEMRLEILEVVKRYVEIDIDDINTNINQRGETEMLELNILLPDTVDIEKKHKASMAQASQKSEQSTKVDSAKATGAESLTKKAQQVATKATEKVDEKIDTSSVVKVSDVAVSAKNAIVTEKHNDEVDASVTDDISKSKETDTKSDVEARLKKAHEELRSLADKSVAPELKKEIPSRTVPRQLKSVNSNKSSR